MPDPNPSPNPVQLKVNPFDESAKYFPTPLQQFQFFDKYSRYDYNLGRRETWLETVTRATDFLAEISENRLETKDYLRIKNGITEMKVMPAMRLLAMAGPAARRDNTTCYNCSFLPVQSVTDFEEAMLISMSGGGVGFSVEQQYVDKFPVVKPQLGKVSKIEVEDSAEGWAWALSEAVYYWLYGWDVKMDYSLLRPAGTPLKTKGGQASGPEPLMRSMETIRRKILARQGMKLRPIDAHDIMCEVGNASISGGVRRTAMLSLFDYDDAEMLHCKDGDFETEDSQRWNANNSAVWPADISEEQFDGLFHSMVKSGRGEPGIFSRKAAYDHSPLRRDWKGKTPGINPCGEVHLRPYQFCNLSIAVAREGDTFETLKNKVEIATIIGTIQSMATHFPYLRPQWKENCEEERLLGVDITGQLDCPVLQNANIMACLKQVAIETNREYAAKLGINQSASVTCVKPSGNSSQLLDCASGLHARWSPYYVRNVRVSAHSPLYPVLREADVPMDPENGQGSWDEPNTYVIHFPVKSPTNAVCRKDRSALEQCEYWLMNKMYWTEHNPSVTVTYKPGEVKGLREWIWANRDRIGGMAFLPDFDAKYEQLPYIEISKEEYEARVADFPVIDFGRIQEYEKVDSTTAAQEPACMSGQCSLDL